MLLLLFAIIVFAFLVLGSIVFLVCALVPPARKYALSAALWCAVLGPCSVGLMMLAGLGLVATAFINKNGAAQSFQTPRLLSAFGWGYLIVGVSIAIAVATAVAWIHQKAVRRFTFPLFRPYATGISAGIGSVFGWCLGWWISLKEANAYGIFGFCIGMFTFVLAFATVACKNARQLRGQAPTSFTWISPEEFEGIDRSN